MVRHSVSRWLVALLALGWAWPVAADAITPAQPGPGVPTGTGVSPLFVTGNVATDLPATSSSVTVVPGQALDAVAQPAWMTADHLVNGYAIQSVRLSYNATTDTMSVGVNFYPGAIAGNVDDTANGGTNPLTTAAGGSNPAHIGGDKSITVAFTPVTAAGTAAEPVVVAGVPSNKVGSPAGSLDGFNVATVNQSAYSSSGMAQAYGTTLTANLGALAYDPSSAHPGFEFTIKNFSKIPGLNGLTNGFYVSAYAGSATTLIVGKSYVPDTLIGPLIKEPQNLNTPPGQISVPVPAKTPEPTTILAWGIVAAGVGWRFRRRLRPSDRS